MAGGILATDFFVTWPAAKVALFAPANQALDEAVHEAKTAQVAAINNWGPADQWAYLLDARGLDEVECFLVPRQKEDV